MYLNTLSQSQLGQLGQLTATWAQIDYLLIGVISKIVGSQLSVSEILLEGAMIGSRITILKKLSSRMVDEKVRSDITAFCSDAHKIADRRNHLAHGMWGLYAAEDNAPVEAACYFPRNKQGLIFAHELPEILARSEDIARRISELYDLAHDVSDTNLHPKGEIFKCFHFGYGSPEGRREAGPGAIYLDLLGLGHSRPDN